MVQAERVLLSLNVKESRSSCAYAVNLGNC